MSTITWLGHAAFRLEDKGAAVLVDPFFTDPAMAARAEQGGVDLVLVTHDHSDHTGDAAGICRRTGARLGAMVETAARLQKAGAPADRISAFNMGGTLRCGGIAATMIPAFHSSETASPVGYIIVMPDGLTVYHAGDTCVFSGMALWGKLFSIDVALLPIGGHYTMDAAQAAMACGLLKCRAVIPMHWGTFPVIAQSPDEFVKLVGAQVPGCQCLPLRPGESVDFQR